MKGQVEKRDFGTLIHKGGSARKSVVRVKSGVKRGQNRMDQTKPVRFTIQWGTSKRRGRGMEERGNKGTRVSGPEKFLDNKNFSRSHTAGGESPGGPFKVGEISQKETRERIRK